VVSLYAPEAPLASTISWTKNGARIAGATKALLTLEPADLPAGGEPLELAAKITAPGGAAGTAALAVPINAAPSCPEPAGCLSLSSASTPFAGPGVVASAAGFTDDGDLSALTYEWGRVNADGSLKPLLIDRAPAFRFQGLPQGVSRVYVTVRDALGASATSTAAINVTAPAAGFKAAAAAAAVDVAAATATKDPSALGRAGAQLAAIKGYASGINTSATDKAAINAAINTKGAALLAATADIVSDWDPEAAQTAAGTAADIMALMTNRTDAARAAGVATGDTRELPRRGRVWGRWAARCFLGAFQFAFSSFCCCRPRPHLASRAPSLPHPPSQSCRRSRSPAACRSCPAPPPPPPASSPPPSTRPTRRRSRRSARSCPSTRPARRRPSPACRPCATASPPWPTCWPSTAPSPPPARRAPT
jgi:hypothetical protein